jgi:hypothetical protein
MHCPLVHVSPNVVQSWHCVPPKPHALAWSPKTHVLPWQQPPQFCGPHVVGATHCWFWHVSPSGTQSWHCCPACPHAPSTLPATHALFWQHPGHVFGLHATGETHAWFTHLSPSGVQFTHVAPPLPHVASSLPSMHVLPTQQPWQLFGPHVGCATHCWLVHVSPSAWQLLHAPPPNPHANDEVPTEHALPWQHPPQLAGPQLGCPTHVPFEHVSARATQSWHVPPPKPHWSDEVPPMHTLPRQHPEQFCGLQMVCA